MTELKEKYLQRISEIEKQITQACEKSNRDRDEVTLVAISKTKSAEEVNAMFNAGIKNFGENKYQELQEKSKECPKDITWHFVGNIQSNKLKKIAEHAHMIHSVDSKKQLDILASITAPVKILFQLSGDGNTNRGGAQENDLRQLYSYAKEIRINIDGIMIVPPADQDPRPYFLNASNLAKDLGLQTLSMGMSHDFETAIECGSTIIRVGTALFGTRIVKNG